MQTMKNGTTQIMIIAGEVSGDLHGGALAGSIKSFLPDCRLFGIGGNAMAEAGVDLAFRVDQLGVTGFSEVLGKLPIIFKAMRWAVSECIRRRPVAAVLIDYPDFNLRLARKLRKAGIRVVYYVSPQLWAWRAGRAESIRKNVDVMMVLFPFEKQWYEARDIPAVYVGNPVVNRIDSLPDKRQCRARINVPESEFLISVLPGSRSNEVKRILPIFTQAAERIAGDFPQVRFILPRAPSIDEKQIEPFFSGTRGLIQTTSFPASLCVKASDFAWVTSGTASLETALAGTPHIIVYRTSWLSYFIAKALVSVPYIGMANLIAGKSIARELIQGELTPGNLVELTTPLISNPEMLAEQQAELLALKEELGTENASRKAAETVLKTCNLLT